MIAPTLSLATAKLLIEYNGIKVQATKDGDDKIVELSVYDGFCTIHEKADKIKIILGDSFRVTTHTNTDTIYIKAIERKLF